MAIKSPQSSPADELPAIEREILEFFVQLAASLSIPKSIGEIFGLLFCAEESLPFEEIVARLGMSKGSTSQGLRFLQKVNAVSTVYVARDRRTFYQAETSMRKIVTGMLNESVRHRLETNEEHLERISAMLEEDDKSNFLRERISSLQSWNRKAGRLLPWLARITAPRSKN